MSDIFIPFIVLVVIIYAYFKKINVYDSFIEGASEGISMAKNMFPSLLAMIFAVNVFSNSDFLNGMLYFFKPFLNSIIPFDVIPIAVLRPLSGSFGLGILNDIYSKYGVDSFISILSSVIQGSSDTTIYIITMYFGTVGVKKIRCALWLGLLADLIMVVLSVIIVPLFM